ncbi:MAG: class I SAM-dependent methyltransferase [Jatrophihabitantaceae bacterium]
MTAGQSAAKYGDRHAGVYDRIYGARFAPDAAVAALARAAGVGRVLELGVGTGRLAIPLARLGIPVDGIEASPAMIDKLRREPGGDRVAVFEVDLDGFQLPRRDYSVAVCAVSTLFMLPSAAAQARCLVSAARHLRSGGRLFVEAFRPDPSRFDADGSRTEQRPTIDAVTHVVRSVHDATAQAIHITHELCTDDEQQSYEVTLTYASDTQLDAMATRAGLRLVDRWHDWSGAPATEASTDPVSVYQR